MAIRSSARGDLREFRYNSSVSAHSVSPKAGGECEEIALASNGHSRSIRQSQCFRGSVSFSVSGLIVWVSLVGSTCVQNSDGLPGTFSAVAEKYGVEVVLSSPKFSQNTHWSLIEGVAAAQVDLKRYEALFCQEFSLYPKPFVEKSKLRQIVLCHGLEFAGQRRYTIPDFEHDVYYLDIGTKDQPDSYLRKVIHHDFFHLVDFRDDGLLYEDERWKSLNPPDFKYSTGGPSALGDATTGELTERFPGFLNHYSTTGVEDDKAEIFPHLFVSSKIVAMRIERDRVLADKPDQMRSLVQSFCPEMDREFWTAAQKLFRPVD